MSSIIELYKESNNSKEKIIKFTNVPHIHEFFKVRGFVDDTDKEVKHINILMLQRSLKKGIEEAESTNDSSKLNKLRIAYENLSFAITHKISKDDKLSLRFA